MPQYAKFEITRQDAAGNPISGATIVLRKQGATVVSGGPTSFTVDDPGGIVTGDTVNVYSSAGTDPGSASVSATVNSATSIDVGGGGFSAANNDRISPSTSLPSVFKDAQGNEAAGTLTTDTNGYASAWVEFQPLDVVSTGGTSALGAAATHIWFDVYPAGIERVKSTAFMSGTTVVRKFDTLRALTSGDKFVEWRSAGTLKFYIDLNASLNPRLPAHNVAGTLTVDTGGINVTGNSTITGTLGGLTGLTVASGTVSLPAGQIGQTELADNSTFVVTSADGTTDQTLTGAYVDITSVTVTITPVSTNSRLVITATVPPEVDSGAGFSYYVQLLEDATTIHETGGLTNSTTNGDPASTAVLTYTRAGFGGSKTYKVQIKRTTGSGGIVRSSTTQRKARIVVVEYVK